jgi:hypothetical protein
MKIAHEKKPRAIQMGLFPAWDARHTSGYALYLSWNSTPKKNQSVNETAIPEITTARANLGQFIPNLLIG